MPVVELSPALLVLTDAVAWFAVSLVAGYVCHRIPDRRLDHDHCGCQQCEFWAYP